jgi:TonB family protein
LRVCPDIRPPEENQICLSFELNSPEPEQKAQGDQGKKGEESNVDESAHLKDRISDSIKASTASAEMNAAEQESGDNKPSAEETETVASKEIISPFAKQSPTESASNGAVHNAKQTTKTPVDEARTSSSSPANLASINAEPSNRSASPNQQDNPSEQVKPNNSRLLEASKKIAQLPPAAAASGGLSSRIDESNAQAQKSVSAAGNGSTASSAGSSAGSPSASTQSGAVSWTGPVQQMLPINAGFLHTETNPNTVELIKTRTPYVALAQPQVGETFGSATTISGINIASGVSSRNASAAPGTAGDGTGSAPSMLGFMDSKLSSDPDMRLLWSQMSSNLSKTIKAQPLKGEGTAVVNFTVDQRGRISSLNTDAVAAELDESLVKSLQSMPSVVPPAKQFSKLYFQVKASNLKTGTVVALEINSEPSAISSETLSDFKYQVNLQTYLKGVKKAIYTAWKPPVQEGVKPVMVGFKVSTDGAVSDQHIVESSGDPKMDRAALNAALSVTQWSQPPAGTSEDLDVCMVLQKCKNCDEELKANQSNNNSGRVTSIQRAGVSGVNRSFPELDYTH